MRLFFTLIMVLIGYAGVYAEGVMVGSVMTSFPSISIAGANMSGVGRTTSSHLSVGSYTPLALIEYSHTSYPPLRGQIIADKKTFGEASLVEKDGDVLPVSCSMSRQSVYVGLPIYRDPIANLYLNVGHEWNRMSIELTPTKKDAQPLSADSSLNTFTVGGLAELALGNGFSLLCEARGGCNARRFGVFVSKIIDPSWSVSVGWCTERTLYVFDLFDVDISDRGFVLSIEIQL